LDPDPWLDPDPLVRDTDPQIGIRNKMSQMPNTDFQIPAPSEPSLPFKAKSTAFHGDQIFHHCRIHHISRIIFLPLLQLFHAGTFTYLRAYFYSIFSSFKNILSIFTDS
jgi:hypothetical protein